MPLYTEDDVAHALLDLADGSTLRAAAARHRIPKNTLRGRQLGAQPARQGHGDQQRLTPTQEDLLEQWIIRQEALGYAPTHAQIRAIATGVLQATGDQQPLGMKWSTHFIRRHPAVKTKLGRRTDWQRIDAVTPASIELFFSLYQTVDWIPVHRRYNADEGGIMEGQGINGLIIGSSQSNPNSVPVKTINNRTWTSIIECISAVGVALDPLVIFKAKSIQEQWFKRDFLEKHPNWQVTFSENGWTSNSIAVEWLNKVFLPQTKPDEPMNARLLIIDGHGSHTAEDFMTICYLNNIYLLFLPAHTSHVLQPLDLGCFSSLKTIYRRLMNEHMALSDTTRIGKAAFLEFYARAREIGLRERNICSRWKATGLWPKSIHKPLRSRWVVIKPQLPLPPPTLTAILSPKCGKDIKRQWASKQCTPSTRLFNRKTSNALDKAVLACSMKDREIKRLQLQLEQGKPAKRRKVIQDPNERFVSLAQVLAQSNQRPEQRITGPQQETASPGESSSESEEEAEIMRRSTRARRPTKRYIERDGGEDKSNSES